MANRALWLTTSSSSSLPLIFSRWSTLASTTFSTSRRYISSMINLQPPPPPPPPPIHRPLPPPHSILFLEALILFINLIQLKFNGKQNSPFETYPIPMAIAVISLFIYFISLEASHWPPFNSVITTHLAAVSGYICIVCIASVLLPSKVVKPYFYLSCPLIFGAVMVCWILKMRRGEQSVWRRRLSQRLSEKVWSFCRNGGVRESLSRSGGCVLPR